METTIEHWETNSIHTKKEMSGFRVEQSPCPDPDKARVVEEIIRKLDSEENQ